MEWEHKLDLLNMAERDRWLVQGRAWMIAVTRAKKLGWKTKRQPWQKRAFIEWACCRRSCRWFSACGDPEKTFAVDRAKI